MDDARSEFEARLNTISDGLGGLATLEDAVGACQELRYVLEEIKEGTTAIFLVEPHENDGRWEVILHLGIDNAMAAIADILTREYDPHTIGQRLQLPLAVARYTMGQSTRLMRA
jgi:hypothetical protein